MLRTRIACTWIWVVVLTTGVLSAQQPTFRAPAQPGPAPQTVLPAGVSELDLLRARLDAQERELQQLRQMIQQGRIHPTGTAGSLADEPKVKRTDTHNEKFSVKVGGRIQYDTT